MELTGTFVKQVSLGNVSLTQSHSLADFRPLATRHINRLDGIQICSFGEGVPGVMHYGVVVVGEAQRVHFFVVQLVEVVLLSWKNHQT